MKLWGCDYTCTPQQHNLLSAGAIKGDECVHNDTALSPQKWKEAVQIQGHFVMIYNYIPVLRLGNKSH